MTDAKKAPSVKLPPTLGACADELGRINLRLREIADALRGLPLSREAERLTARHAALEAKLLEELPASDADGICGRAWRATIKSKRVPTIQDWAKLTAYVRRSGNFELFHRRVNTEAVTELWDAKRQVPGITGFTVKKVSITKK